MDLLLKINPSLQTMLILDEKFFTKRMTTGVAALFPWNVFKKASAS
jgi:hypothetical protein